MQIRNVLKLPPINKRTHAIVTQVKFNFSPNCFFSISKHQNKTHFRKSGGLGFFDVLHGYYLGPLSPKKAIDFISNEKLLKKFLYEIDPSLKENYLMNHFIYWFSQYSTASNKTLFNYLSGNLSLNSTVRDFIIYCFKNKISLHSDQTLKSFEQHNALSDNHLKNELLKLKPKPMINILGYGLDDGSYEKTLSKFLIDNNIAKEVTIFGFDPYALKTPGITYLSDTEFSMQKLTKFDVITSRWVLHHVELRKRWEDFINCINQSNDGVMVLIVEHGFLNKKCMLLEKKIYYLFNAIFDVVANIGLRPRYFTNSEPNIGEDFFIHYLTNKDFNDIRKGVKKHVTHDITEVGPRFPNQTIFSMRVTS